MAQRTKGQEEKRQSMIYKRGKVYWYKFVWTGKLIRESTKQGNDKIARQMEAAHRVSLAKGEVGIRDKKVSPTLAGFLKNDFLPFAATKHASKPKTLAYYSTGAASLVASPLGGLRLDEITDQHAQAYAARLCNLSPSTINCGLRTLRRAIYLAAEWGTTERRPKITLAKGEKQRDTVLSREEVEIYLKACDQPWRDAATVMLGTGMRPGEVFGLRWEHVLLNGGDGLIQVTQGKSKAARRVLPMVPLVRETLAARWKAADEPVEGWIFPSQSSCGHFESSTAKNQHGRALKKINKEVAEDKKPNLKPFEPYCLRHTALTRLGESGCDVFTLARIAGHSNIQITMRYVHPQAEAIGRAFSRLTKESQSVADAGRHKNGHTGKTRLLRAGGVSDVKA
jgi:integrase